MADGEGPSSSPSLFHQSQSTTISGGEFTNTAGDHNGLVVNIYHGRQINPTHQEIIPQGVQPQHPVVPEAPSTDEREAPNARYERHLLVEKHGFPLWSPQPHNRLPLSYRRKGVSIGDVGIITREGYFDFLFNVCLPLGHASNPAFLPTNFSPVYLLPTDISEFRQHDLGSCLLTASTEKLRGLSFKCNGPEGSILVMPNGAYHEDLLNLHKFQRIASQNAENWYRFAIGTCGRAIGNGELRLVTGCDKTNLWGIATYSDSPSGSITLVPNTVQSPVEFIWDYEGRVEAKAGPRLDEFLDNAGNQEYSRDTRNQCTFLRSFTVSVADDVWENMISTLIPDSSDNHTLNFRQPRSYFTSVMSGMSIITGFSGLGNRGGSANVASDSLGGEKLTMHPATLINEMLLSQFPNAKVAISHDNDWCSIIREDEITMPDVFELLNRIRQTFVFQFDDDRTVYLSREHAPDANPNQEPPSPDSLVTTPRYSGSAQRIFSFAGDDKDGNPISTLNNLCQRSRLDSRYNFKREGPIHNELWAAEVTIDGKVSGSGTGKNQASAKRAAAEQALRSLSEEYHQIF